MMDRKTAVNWYRNNQAELGTEYMFIPPGQSNAFVGVMAGGTSASVAILDFDLVVQNFVNKGMPLGMAKEYAVHVTDYGPSYGPMLIHQI